MPKVIVEFPSGSEEIALKGQVLRIGRDPRNDVTLEDGDLSRHHCVIEPISGRWCIRDLGSRNGTYLGGRRIADSLLSHGDLVRCGQLRIRFIDEHLIPSRRAGADAESRVAWGWIIGGAVTSCAVVGLALLIAFREGEEVDRVRKPTTEVKTLVAPGTEDAAESTRQGTISSRAPSEASAGAEPPLQVAPQSTKASEREWYLLRSEGASVEGPLSGAAIRKANRWGELDASVRTRKGPQGEWVPLSKTELSSGYGPDEPQSGSDVRLDLEPIEYVRQIIDFKRFGMLDAAEDLLARLTDIDANLRSSASSTMKARKHLESLIAQSSHTIEAMRRMRAAIRRAHAQGVITDTVEDVVRMRLQNVEIKTHASGKGWRSYIAGDDWLSFFRVEDGWRLDLLPVTGMRSLETGAPTPGAIIMLTEWGKRPPSHEQQMAETVMQVMPDVANRVISAIEGGCFESASQAEAVFKQAAHRESLLRAMDANGGDRDRSLVASLADPIDEACRRSRQRQQR